MQSFDVFFNRRLNKRFSKQSKRRWFQTPSRLLWRHINVSCVLDTISPRSNLAWYWIKCDLKKAITLFRLWTQKRYLIPRPYHAYRRAMHRRFWILSIIARDIESAPCTANTNAVFTVGYHITAMSIIVHEGRHFHAICLLHRRDIFDINHWGMSKISPNIFQLIFDKRWFLSSQAYSDYIHYKE